MILNKQNSHLLSTVYYVHQVILDTDGENKKEGRDIIWVHNELKTIKDWHINYSKRMKCYSGESYSGTQAEEQMRKSNLNLS